jgi:hypothetical protein
VELLAPEAAAAEELEEAQKMPPRRVVTAAAVLLLSPDHGWAWVELECGFRRELGDAMSRGRVPCNIRGASYYNCRPGAPANPYSRGCSAIARCRVYSLFRFRLARSKVSRSYVIL